MSNTRSIRIRDFALRLWIAACVSAFLAGPCSAAISQVQHTNKDVSTNVSSTTLAYVSNVTANNLLVVVVRSGGAVTSITITDTIGNTWTNGTFHAISATGSLQISWSVNSSSAADTITVTPNSASTIRVAIYEFSGTATASVLDVQENVQSGTGTGPDSTSFTPAQDNELVVGAAIVDNTATFTAGTNYTLQDAVPASPNTKLGVETWIQTTATATTANFTVSGNPSWMAARAAFKQASGGGGAPRRRIISARANPDAAGWRR